MSKIVKKNVTLAAHIAAKGDILAERTHTGNFSALISELISEEAARRIPELESELAGYREKLKSLGDHPGSSEDTFAPRDRALTGEYRRKRDYFEMLITDLDDALTILKSSKYFEPPPSQYIPTMAESEELVMADKPSVNLTGPLRPKDQKTTTYKTTTPQKKAKN